MYGVLIITVTIARFDYRAYIEYRLGGGRRARRVIYERRPTNPKVDDFIVPSPPVHNPLYPTRKPKRARIASTVSNCAR